MSGGTEQAPGPRVRLVRPGWEHLESHLDALRRGWSPNTLDPDAGWGELRRAEANVETYLASMEDRGGGGRVVLPDGTSVPRIPGLRYWLWDGEFCGMVSFRWVPGTTDLPPHCLGHVGYSVVPWKQRRGYATAGLRQALELARTEGLAFVEVTTEPENVGSQKVIERCGGILVEEFERPRGYGGGRSLRYRIPLT